jgi:transcription factor SFP1
MELDADSSPSSSASSPPSTPPMDSASAFDISVLRPSSRMPTSAYTTPSHSRPHSPHSDCRADAFNQYASYSRFSSLMPGAVETPPPDSSQSPNAKCIPPALLFSSSAQTTPTGSPAGSRISSPVPHKTNGNVSASARKSSQSAASSAKDAGGSSTTLSRPAAALMLSKPFRCPTVGCNKSYKQANGLKYHITHGQCNFMPRDPSLDGLDDHEADQKSRPYVCQVGSCTRRYKNMNGLRESSLKMGVSPP